MCVLTLQLLSETFLILGTTERDIINIQSSSCKVLVFLVRYKCNFGWLYLAFGLK